MQSKRRSSSKDRQLPEPVPALTQFHRVPEVGIDTREYIGLDRNERLSPFPEWFMDGIRQSVSSNLLTWYPVQDQLHSQLSEVLHLREDQLLLAPSSDAAFKAVYQAYIRPGDGVLMLDPSYAMFPVYAQMFEGESIPILYNQDLELDTEFLLSSIAPGVRLLMIANPNQPTGTVLDDEILREMIERAAGIGALVVVDEAYYPFAHTTALPWLDRYSNLLVIRTFSKAAGLAGLRIGFAAGHPEVIGNLYKVRTVNDLNSMSILCASQVLKYPQIIDDYVAEVEEGRRLLANKATDLGLTVLPSHANFLLIRVGHRCTPVDLVEALKRRGYLVKGLGAPCVSDCIRVTLGPSDLMSDFAESLRQALESDL